MQWLTRNGPFWEDSRLHNPSDYLECCEEIVTDSAIGEAALASLHEVRRDLVSLSPSSWEYTPIDVYLRGNDDKSQLLKVVNHWHENSLTSVLEGNPLPISSWQQLATFSKSHCSDLIFSEDAFKPLEGSPFVPGASEKILMLLKILNFFKNCFDEKKKRTMKGHQLYQEYFTGSKAWFTDSSVSEKHDFISELTFKHPKDGAAIFCPWHGKVKSHQMRVHFSWPIRSDEPLYVVYIGPKITKR
ncbi:MAG: hypothetical protein HQM10_19970 [Candidatus Riflebacteria bacterium]|nr:hypothetical protein [Candidatus Riflebacteria bacterium]